MSKLTELAIKFYDLRQEKNALSAKIKEIGETLGVIEKAMLEELAHEGMDRFDIKGKGSFFTSNRRFYKIVSKEPFIDFIHEQGDTDLLSVMYQTLNAYSKELYARKEAEGIKDFTIPGVEFTEKPSIKMRKLGNESETESDEE